MGAADIEEPDGATIIKILLLLVVCSSMTRVFFWFAYNRNILGVLSAVGIVVAILAGVYVTMQPAAVTSLNKTEAVQSMADNASENIKTFRASGKTAFVVGYTGESGKELVKELAQSKIFSRVTLIGRRQVEYSQDLFKDFNVEQKVIDFDKLEESADVFHGHDVGFCCLGTTRAKAGIEGFKRVDRDYVLKTAELAKEGGTTHFNLVSSQGADPNKTVLYFHIKGQVEEEIKAIGFDRLSIYQPGVLMCDREETRMLEWVLRKVLAPLEYFAPGVMTTATNTLAKALVHVTVAPKQESIEILNGKDIYRLSQDNKKDHKR